MTLIAVDLFAGAGGATAGLIDAVGDRPLDLTAVNHWPLAVDSHRRNHPQARHLCADVASLSPQDVVPGGRLDVLVGGPQCTYFSRGRAGLPVSDQRRSGPGSILDWLTVLQVEQLVVENVPEFADWGPVDGTGKRIKARRGQCFAAWTAMIRALGYEVEHRVLCCADYGDPTTRPRLFVRASRSGPVRWPEPTHGPGRLHRWRTARDILDLDHVGPRVSDRRRPLNAPTRRRIATGLDRFEGAPFVVIYYGQSTVRSLDAPLPTVTAGSNKLALCTPTDGTVDGAFFRFLTVRELARAQSLDELHFGGTQKEQIRQIGNAVPKRTASAVIGAALSADRPARAARVLAGAG